MSAIDEPMAWATMPVPGPGNSDEQNAAFDALPIAELAALWRHLQHLGLRDQSDQSWAATLYFDRLPHDSPERALDLALAVLASDAETRVKMQLGEKFMSSLIYQHADRLIDRIEAEQAGNAKFRWLLGAVHWWATRKETKERLARIADEAAWRAAEALRDMPETPIDFTALPVPELARAWVDQHAKPEKDRDANWHALMDYERELVRRNPDKVVDLVLEILDIESSPEMLSLLAASLVEDVIGPGTIDRIEREAAANAPFRDLLGGVWSFNQPETLKARLEAVVKGRHW
jgi:hypothetical protein